MVVVLSPCCGTKEVVSITGAGGTAVRAGGRGGVSARESRVRGCRTMPTSAGAAVGAVSGLAGGPVV
jgi:hypothetical protein